MRIELDDLSGDHIALLLQDHMNDMMIVSPPESRHALDLSELRSPDITFWSVWDNCNLAGCGAIKEIDRAHGEVKSMRTAHTYGRRGVASMLLEYILEVSRERGYRRLSLETGSMEYFEPARFLYQKYGFQFCAPFGSYTEDTNSVFMNREL